MKIQIWGICRNKSLPAASSKAVSPPTPSPEVSGCCPCACWLTATPFFLTDGSVYSHLPLHLFGGSVLFVLFCFVFLPISLTPLPSLPLVEGAFPVLHNQRNTALSSCFYLNKDHGFFSCRHLASLVCKPDWPQWHLYFHVLVNGGCCPTAAEWCRGRFLRGVV